MVPFEYTRAITVNGAVEESSHPGARYLAGGTTIIDLMKLDVERPSRLVDVAHLDLGRIEALPDGGLRIGALVTNSDCARNSLVRARFPVLSEAILAGASPQLRNMATTGGNILQRTRCPYFRDTASPCNKRTPGSGCSAVGGYNRMHAVLGGSDSCIAVNPSDMNVALAALGAAVATVGSSGRRRIPFTEFHLLPDSRPDQETALLPGEMITAVEIPALPFAVRSTYLKVRDRAQYAFALASAAVCVDLDGDVIRAARIALGGVGTKPWRCKDAETALAGKPATDGSFRAAAEIALAGAKGYPDNEFKIELAKRTLVRALRTASRIA